MDRHVNSSIRNDRTEILASDRSDGYQKSSYDGFSPGWITAPYVLVLKALQTPKATNEQRSAKYSTIPHSSNIFSIKPLPSAVAVECHKSLLDVAMQLSANKA